MAIAESRGENATPQSGETWGIDSVAIAHEGLPRTFFPSPRSINQKTRKNAHSPREINHLGPFRREPALVFEPEAF